MTAGQLSSGPGRRVLSVCLRGLISSDHTPSAEARNLQLKAMVSWAQHCFLPDRALGA